MKLLKRCVCLICIAWILLACASAQTQVPIECDCNASPCRCYLQLGDEGAATRAVITLLKEQGYMADSRIKATYTESVEMAVKAFQRAHQLPESGQLDDQTLTLLVYGSYALNVPEGMKCVVWVPSNGGEKYHRASVCKRLRIQMINPRKITLNNAVGLGMQARGLCKPPSYPGENAQN